MSNILCPKQKLVFSFT